MLFANLIIFNFDAFIVKIALNGLPEYTLKCLIIGTPKIINFPFVPVRNLMVLDVPICKYFINSL